MVLSIAILTSLIDRYFSAQALALELSEKRSRQILETALDAFVETDAAGVIVDWNAQAEAMFGWTREEALGQWFDHLVFPERLHSFAVEARRRFVAAGEGPAMNKRVEVIATHRDGHEFPVEFTPQSCGLVGHYYSLRLYVTSPNASDSNRTSAKPRSCRSRESSQKHIPRDDEP